MIDKDIGVLKDVVDELEDLDRPVADAKSEADDIETEHGLDIATAEEKLQERMSLADTLEMLTRDHHEQAEQLWDETVSDVLDSDKFEEHKRDGMFTVNGVDLVDVLQEYADHRERAMHASSVAAFIGLGTTTQLAKSLKKMQRIHGEDRVYEQIDKITDKMMETHETLMEKKVDVLMSSAESLENVAESLQDKDQKIEELRQENQRLRQQLAEHEATDQSAGTSQNQQQNDGRKKEKIIKLLEDTDMTQEKIADVVGTDQAYVSEINTANDVRT